MNGFDILIMLFFGGIVALAFFGGLGKVFSTLVGLYFGVVFAAFFYHPLAVAVAHVLPSMALFTGDLLMFVLLLGLSTLGFTAVLARTFVLGRLPAWLGAFNNISGGVIGILVATFATILAAMVVALAVQVLDHTAASGTNGFLGMVHDQMRGAALVPIFLKLVPTVVSPLHPWFPKGLPPILAPGSY